MTNRIEDLMTAYNADAYHTTVDQWLYCATLLDTRDIPNTDKNIELLEDYFDSVGV